jgi:uncharacterized RDD family membrane protein YckC
MPKGKEGPGNVCPVPSVPMKEFTNFELFCAKFGLNPMIESTTIIIFFIAIMNPFVPDFYSWFLVLFSKQIVKIKDKLLKTNKKGMHL